MKSSLSYSLGDQQPSFLTDIWGPLSTPSWESLLPHSWKIQAQITIMKARHPAQRLTNTVHSWTPLRGPSREGDSRLGHQDNFREDVSSLSLEDWPGCQQRDGLEWRYSRWNLQLLQKGENARCYNKGQLSSLPELWVCAGESRRGDVLKSSPWRVLHRSVSSSYLSVAATVIWTLVWSPINLRTWLYLYILPPAMTLCSPMWAYPDWNHI